MLTAHAPPVGAFSGSLIASPGPDSQHCCLFLCILEVRSVGASLLWVFSMCVCMCVFHNFKEFLRSCDDGGEDVTALVDQTDISFPVLSCWIPA